MRRLLPLSILLLLVAMLGPACGGSDRKPVAVLAAATTKTIDAKSSRVALDMNVAAAAGQKAATITAEGLVDYVTQKATMSMDMSSLGAPGLTGKIDMVLLGDVIYMKLPAGLLPGKPWLKLDLATLGQSSGIDLAGLQQFSSSDPSAHLRYFVGAGDDTKKVGSETVRGVDTTHYKGTFDLEKAKADAPADLKDDIDKVIAQLGKSTFPGDVWVDGNDLVRRVRFTITPKAGTADAAAQSVTISEDLYDFGVKVDASPPPADQVSDFAQLLAGAGQK